MKKLDWFKSLAAMLVLAAGVQAQTQVSELTHLNGSCSEVSADPGFTDINYIHCTDTTTNIIKIYSFPNLDFVKQINIPQVPMMENTRSTSLSITQKWFNDDENFEFLQIRTDTARVDGRSTSYYTTYIYNESGSILFSADGYLRFGIHNNIKYLYSSGSLANGKNVVYRFNDIQTITKVGELTNDNGDCDMVPVDPGSTGLSGYMSCMDTPAKIIKIYSFPDLNFVKQFNFPPAGNAYSNSIVNVTQKWFNDDNDFEILQNRTDTIRINGSLITDYTTHIYNEFGHLMLSVEGSYSVVTDVSNPYYYFMYYSDATEELIKISSLPNLELVKQFNYPPKGNAYIAYYYVPTQKRFNEDDDFEIIQIRADTTRVDGALTSYITQHIYNESGSLLFSTDGSVNFGIHNNTKYLYSLNGRISGKSIVYKLYDLDVEPSSTHLPKIAASNQVLQIHNGVNLQSTNNAVLEIYSLKGNLISKQKFNSGVYTVSFEHLPKGLYIVNAKFGDEKQILRMSVR